MSLTECQNAYLKLSRDIFTGNEDSLMHLDEHMTFCKQMEDSGSETLEKNIKDILEAKNLHEDELLKG